MKNNIFKEAKHIQQINIHRHHLVHYLPAILLERDHYNKNYTITLTDEIGNRRSFYNFQNETTLENMLKLFLRRHQDSQDRTKITTIPNSTYELIRNTIEFLSGKTKQLTSVNDRLRNDIINYNNWLTRIIEIKPDMNKATLEVVRIISEFTFLFWLDNI